ncbi:ATPase domain-containing protein [Agreia sp. VKM Ac-1783]|uniref:ATPase domain-containing protein n=1 Tax=Agreia sp. VKM Ac-1783 TaxID=1938889 RepID=UPI000A2ABE09|nr:ATPase domain-containing protein [Agreia sp. VKM Ac-1783]SMQ74873.1 circadian clock protein KaiC [Agreia sp. VKM Ac-1783]
MDETQQLREVEARSVLETGIAGLDHITGGGLPRGRVITIFGAAGAGKTVLGLQILAHRVAEGERAVFISFEQTADGVLEDMAGFSWGADGFAEDDLIVLETGMPTELHVSGRFDMQGLIATLLAVTDASGATIVMLDGLNALLSLLLEEADERRELLRLTDWVRSQGLTVLITAKASAENDRARTRAEILDYQTDCVVVLDRLQTGNSISRTLQVTKYRGAAHIGHVVPVVMTNDGLEVVIAGGLASEELASGAPSSRPDERMPTGVEELDPLLGGGYLLGSRTLLSGAPGTSKSTLAAAFSLAVVRGGGRVLYVSFDEVRAQLELHTASVGYSFREPLESGSLRILEESATGSTPEESALRIIRAVDELGANAVVIDPVSALTGSGHPFADEALSYLLTSLSQRGITVLLTSLLHGAASLDEEATKSNISTIADNWIHLTYIANGGERNRALTIVKSRATAHTNQVRELVITSEGIELRPAYVSDGDVLLGSARAQKEELDRTAAWLRAVEYERGEAEILASMAELEGRISGLGNEVDLRRRDLERLRSTRDGALERTATALEARVAARGSGNLANEEGDQR